jgi:hypothetical protein
VNFEDLHMNGYSRLRHVRGGLGLVAFFFVALSCTQAPEPEPTPQAEPPAKENTAATEQLVRWEGQLASAQMQHPIIEDEQRYLRLPDGGEKLVVFNEGVELPESQRKVELWGKVEEVDLGGPAGTRGSYKNSLLRVQRWSYVE